MTIYRPRVYTASKLMYYKFWRHIRADPDWDFVEFTASWVESHDVFLEVEGRQPSPEAFRDGWIKDIAEVKDSDFVILYGKPTDLLRGCLIECGVALGNGIPVLVAEVIGDEHTWLHHPGVKCFPSLREARDHLYKYITMAPPTRRKRGKSND